MALQWHPEPVEGRYVPSESDAPCFKDDLWKQGGLPGLDSSCLGMTNGGANSSNLQLPISNLYSLALAPASIDAA